MIKKLFEKPVVEEVPVTRGASRVAVPQTEIKTPWRLNLRWSLSIDWNGWLKPALILGALVLFIVLGGSAAQRLYQWLDQPVAGVTVVGETRYLSKRELAATTAKVLSGGLLSADIRQVKEEIQAHPWIYQVNVSRNWPAALRLDVKEEIPVARWGQRGLLNHEGDIFWPEGAASYATLPLLNGPSSNTEQMMAQYHDLNQMLRGVGLQVVELSLEARGAWTLRLDNGLQVVVGREHVVERLERFLSVYQSRLKEFAEAGRIEQVDVRYTNGMAVKWRQQPDAEQEQKG